MHPSHPMPCAPSARPSWPSASSLVHGRGQQASQPRARVWVWAATLGLLACGLATLLHPQGALAQTAGPPTAPQLRIEAGMHTAAIRHIATDVQGRWAVTASDDKTARVWDVASGQLLQVLRPPLAAGNEGKLNAVALSPDGAVVAVAGWTKLGSETGHTVYLFNRSTGQMLRRLSGLPNVIGHLAFSLDGRWLAATLGDGGLRVWRWAEGSAPLVDSDYQGGSYAASFAQAPTSMSGPSGPGTLLLATSSYDGQVRLYRLGPDAPAGSPLKPVHTLAAPGGKQPLGLAFAPGGQQLAVGYLDSTRVDVLSVAPGPAGQPQMALSHTPSSAGVDNGDLSKVAFSADGQTLAAAGQWDINGRHPVRLWPQAGRGQPQDLPTAHNTVMGLAPLPSSAGGGWLVGASGPAWGRVHPSSGWQPKGQAPTADLRGSRGDTAFLLADSGRVLQFGYEPFGKPPHQFHLRERRLQAGALPGGQPPRTQGLGVEGWEDTTRPTLNGQPLKLNDYERARSLAALPAAQGREQGFALGADYRLRFYAADGAERWPDRAVPGVVWGVNIPQTGDLAGKVIVAAYGGGTIRWHRVSDGQELLAFFPHADRKRWVLWTPSGYYDASAGGEELIGWHLNRGADAAADFFPASRFRDKFYRPDIIDRVLDTLDEAQAVAQADAARGSARPSAPVNLAQALPPVVELPGGHELRTTQTALTLRVRARTAADAGVTQWRVRINGQLQPEVRGLGRQDAAAQRSDEREFSLTLPPQDSVVEVFATNRHGESSPGTLRVSWAGAKPGATSTGAAGAGFEIQPKLYVLAVGVAQYQHPSINKLALPAKDARDFVAALQRQKGRLYRDVEVKLLTDREASKDAILDGMDWLQRSATQHDVAMMFVAGHGLIDGSRGYTFLPVGADPDRLLSTGVRLADIRSVLGQMQGKAMFFFDSCHSGGVFQTTGGLQARNAPQDLNGVINELASAENGVVVFSSSSGRQLSYEDTAWGNGAFTKALVEGLLGKASQPGHPRITFKMLDLYVSERVKGLTGGRQTPVTQAALADFPVAVGP